VNPCGHPESFGKLSGKLDVSFPPPPPTGAVFRAFYAIGKAFGKLWTPVACEPLRAFLRASGKLPGSLTVNFPSTPRRVLFFKAIHAIGKAFGMLPDPGPL